MGERNKNIDQKTAYLLSRDVLAKEHSWTYQQVDDMLMMDFLCALAIMKAKQDGV